MSMKLFSKLAAQPNTLPSIGHWAPIRYCFDQDTGEFLNVGVIYRSGAEVAVRMLDTPERLKCLYDDRLNLEDVFYRFQSVENEIITNARSRNGEICELADDFQVGDMLYAAGEDPFDIALSMYEDVVTLGRSKVTKSERFVYKSHVSVKNDVTDYLREQLPDTSESFIQKDAFVINVGRREVAINVPLVGQNSCGDVISAYYKDNVRIENALLKAESNLYQMKRYGHKNLLSLSVLKMPSRLPGVTNKEWNAINSLVCDQLDRLDAQGVSVLESDDATELGRKTLDWWRERAA